MFAEYLRLLTMYICMYVLCTYIKRDYYMKTKKTFKKLKTGDTFAERLF